MNRAKYYTQQKFDVLEDIDLSTNLLILQQFAAKWCKSKPDNLLRKTTLSYYDRRV